MKTHSDKNNIQVFAVEPANVLADIGARQTEGLNVKWLEDSLPALHNVSKQEVSFDLILLSAVWMHVPQRDRDMGLTQRVEFFEKFLIEEA